MASHEENKAERRERIIHAARSLIRETGRTGLSMRALAARAGVSLATPYNLLGSKEGVLKALLETDLREFRGTLAAPGPDDPIDRTFDAIAEAARLYSRDERFYRTLFLALFEPENAELRDFYEPGRQHFWAELLLEAAQAGLLADWVDIAALARNIRYVIAGVVHRWAMSGGGSDWIEGEIGYGVSLLLRAAATPTAMGRVQARLKTYQERIAQHRPPEPAAGHPIAIGTAPARRQRAGR